MSKYHHKWTRGKKKFPIIKSSGFAEPFSAQKLNASLRRSGLPPKKSQAITDEIIKTISPGSRTKDIYRKAYQLVRRESSMAAAHYSLKRAILELGPTGFEFERFVAKYFQAIGFETKVGVVLDGEFVKHEVDVVAKGGNSLLFVECKFHNHIGRPNDIKVALYVKARWDDLKNGPEGKKLTDFYLVSNTTFTIDAIQYAKGTGLKLLGVNAPPEESFLDKINRYKLYPITSLRRLRKYEIGELLKKDIILCQELLKERTFLKRLGRSEQEIDLIFSDISNLLGAR